MADTDNVPFKPPGDFHDAISSLKSHSNDDNLFDLIKNGSDTTELWLIQTPTDLDITKMSGNRLHLTGDATRCRLESNGKDYELWSRINNNTESNSVLVLKPDIEEKNIEPCLSSFSGNISIVSYVSVPDISTPEVVKKKMKIPDGLKQRFVPYGSGFKMQTITQDEIVKLKKRKRKRDSKKNRVLNEVDEEEQEEVTSPKTPKRIKKDDTTSKSNREKKKKKKKSSRHQ